MGFGGIVIKLTESPALTGYTSSSQDHPLGFYLYGHYDAAGSLFYVGKGKDRRAWDREDRHFTWKLYVEKNLSGKFDVRILADQLDCDEAEELESALMMENPDTLINWVHWGRKDDFEAINRRNALAKDNRDRSEAAWKSATTDLDGAIATCRLCVEHIADFAYINGVSGVLGQVLRDYDKENGYQGDFHVFDRYARLLLRANRIAEAKDAASEYFGRYKMDLRDVQSMKLMDRITVASVRAEQKRTSH